MIASRIISLEAVGRLHVDKRLRLERMFGARPKTGGVM